MKFSKWGGWRDGWTCELLPRITYKPKTTYHSYSTVSQVIDGFRGRKRTGPITERTSWNVSLAWLWSAITFQWEDTRELSEEEALEYEAKEPK